MPPKFNFILFFFLLNNSVFCASLQSKVDAGLSETEVQIDSGNAALFGTLVVPTSVGKIPVVLIVPGSGPIDRDGNNAYGLLANSYKYMASGLSQEGIASLRIDKRGVGKSKKAMIDERVLVLGTYIADCEKWIKYLKKDPRFSKIIILGHGEGALIGTITANFQRADGFISLSGAGYSADTMIIKQLYIQSPALADSAKIIIDHILKSEPFDVNPQLSSIFRPSVTHYLKSWFMMSPVVELSILRCPVLIIQGSTDLQVSIDDANRLERAKPGSKKHIIENMNQVLKTASLDMEENLATYKNPDLPLAAALIPILTEFIRSIDP